MNPVFRWERPTLGVLAGWQFYRTATNLSYLKPVFAGMARAARDLNCNLLLGGGMGASASPTDPPRPAWPVPAADADYLPISPDNVDGLLACLPLHSPDRSRYLEALVQARFPVLFVGTGAAGPTLAADNVGGIFEAVGHLVSHGHRQIAFIAGSPDDLEGDTGDRLRAYQAALAGHGLAADPRRVVYGRHIYAGGYAAVQELLAGGAAFTAILASNDEMALGAMQALTEAGRRVPEDTAVIGFDNRLEGAAHRPSLSSIHVPLFNLGYQAVGLLLRHLEGRAPLPDTLTVPTHLITRESCGCGRGRPAPAGPDLVQAIAAQVWSHAQSLTETDARTLSQQLLTAFTASVDHASPAEFEQTLEQILETTRAGDDAHLWQDALTLLEQAEIGRRPAARAVLDQARLTISAALERQHRQLIVEQRWTNSRLSLLTADLLTALDPDRIYTILAEHLPALGIPQAWVVQFEAEAADPWAWSRVRDVLAPAAPLPRLPTPAFPPAACAAGGFRWTLIPLADQSGQLGYMVFGTEQLDLYGAVVQQVGSALNTARLYQQATAARRLAEEANALKSRFLSTISHELRTPLNLIVGLSGLMLQESENGAAPLPAATRQDIDRIRAYSQHLGGLIGDVIDLATSDAGQLRLNTSHVDLAQALRMAAESGRQLAADKGLAWEADLPAAGPWVWGDPTRLRQVALNLIHNAVKFTARGGVSLRLTEEGGRAVIQVRDTGLGIPPAEQHLIFDEFRQSERSVTRGFGGLGLGLAICQRLVALHDGALTVASAGEDGAGSTFTFTLPVVQPPADHAGPPAADHDRPAHTILVVDDEPNTRALQVRIVRAHSPANRALTARSGAEALEILAKESVDLVLLDLQMPGMDGFAVLDWMRGRAGLRETPVIVLTGQVLTAAEMARLSPGVTAVLGNGLFSLEETVAHISAALEPRRRLSREAQRLVRTAMAYVHSHYAEPLSRRTLAQQVGITEDHLTFCFRQELGATPIEYLQRYRMQQAKRLLKETADTVTKIAAAVGYPDSGYFSRLFRRETGLSPEAFRRSNTAA